MAYSQYRALDMSTPIQASNLIGTLNAAFDTNANFTFMQSAKPESDVFYGLMDLTNVQTGDYLVGQEGTFFVSYIEPFKAPVCIKCPRTLSISRQDDVDTPGLQPRAGYSGGEWPSIVSGLPASMQLDRERGKPKAGIPGDVISELLWKIRISPVFGSTVSASWWDILRPGDRIREDQSNQMFQVTEVIWHPTDWLLKAKLLSPSAG
jgi:hypothetical protein